MRYRLSFLANQFKVYSQKLPAACSIPHYPPSGIHPLPFIQRGKTLQLYSPHFLLPPFPGGQKVQLLDTKPAVVIRQTVRPYQIITAGPALAAVHLMAEILSHSSHSIADPVIADTVGIGYTIFPATLDLVPR